ncbi:Uncharacterised protein [Mycobacteroides abscessus subsp. bolletii]|uniref:hypothetical protein n=1 Tax=Mycobacteroides abscessus TaxID=36809 RepID=UPI0009A66810|nr:hypothetical protein [Mycobacteroides abscessus]SKY32037.1 Uncharacterised protein [Mycobacteroides abscessus subsp. bolletii]
MSINNPRIDALNTLKAVKVPNGWGASQKLVDLLKQHAEKGTQIGIEQIDALLDCIVGSQIEVIHAFGAREAQAAEIRESFKSLGDLFKRGPKGE